jgi:hypothetical protein
MHISYYLYISILQTPRSITSKLIAHDAHGCAAQPHSLQVVEEDYDSKALKKCLFLWRIMGTSFENKILRKTTCHVHVPITKVKEKLCKMCGKKKQREKP